jgi:formylglycine-generating enzyme required for sulfatase activity
MVTINRESGTMARVKCSKCGFINPEGQAACANCSTPLPKVRSVAGVTPSGPTPAPQGRASGFRPGQTVASRYTVVDVIGRGGMGCIYRVRDNALGEEVALKTLLPQFVSNNLVVERFFNEARIARHLSHPNIIRVHDIGQAEKVVYISMELLKGKSLRNVIDDLASGQYLPLDKTLQILDDLCAALEYAHQYTVHRDIKPENVMIAPDGGVKLMDFGISKLMANQQLTAASIVMGTPMYMSPEQLKNSRDVDARADVFSVGVVLYEMLTGTIPTGVPKPASQIRRAIPVVLDEIVAKCVEPNREARYQTVTELRDALLGVRVMVEASARTIAAVSKNKEKGPVLRRAAGLLLVVAILALTGLGIRHIDAKRTAVSREAAPVAAPAAPAGESLDAQLKRMQACIDRVRSRAESAARDKPALQDTLVTAAILWDQAKAAAAQQSASALDDGVRALQCYIALADFPPEMLFIPPGEVTLRDETGTGVIQVDGFFIDETEVTAGAFAQFCTESGWRMPPYLDATPSDAPVTMVTFYDALAYAVHENKSLPTEAQWMRAACGGKGASERFPWGETWEDGKTNVMGSEDGFPGVAPVRSFAGDRTVTGCFDMAGNVMEWTRSAFRPLPYQPGDGREDVLSFDFGTEIALRGSHFGMTAAPLPMRYHTPYESMYETLGFRCVRELPSTLDAIEAML